MKKGIALLLMLTVLLAIGMTGCKPAATTDNSKQLVAEIGPNPETIDPALNSAVDGGNYILFAFDGLLNIDKDNKIIAGAAKTWETSKDGLTWTFHLNEGMKWSDGSDLTAEDFVYSWKRVADPKTAAPYGSTVLGMVKGFDDAAKGNLDSLGVSAPDKNTFVVTLANPCTYFDKLAAFATLNPVNKATIEKNGDSWATKPETYICNGPFYISEWVPSSYIMFKKNPNYRDASSIKLDSMKMLLQEDPNASYSAYQNGQAMLIKDVPTEQIKALKGNPEFHIDPLLGTYYISTNDSKKMFSDSRVREALSLAIDRKYVAETLMEGVYTPASNFIGTGVVDWDGSSFMDNANGGKPYIDIDDHAGNLEKAKQLLAEAGYPNGKNFPNVTYSINDSGYHKIVAEYLQQAWKELGINVKVDVVEWASFTPLRRAGDYEVSRNGWLFDYNDASNMLELLKDGNGNNDGKYNNKDYNAALDKAAAEIDPEKRSGYLHDAEDIMMKDTACIPVAYYNEFYLQSSKITGSWHSPYGYWYLQYADITK